MLLTKLKACYLQRHHKNWYSHHFCFLNSIELTAGKKHFCDCKCRFKQPIHRSFFTFYTFWLTAQKDFQFHSRWTTSVFICFPQISNNPSSWQGQCCKENIEQNVKTCARDSGLLIHLKKCWKAIWLHSLRRLKNIHVQFLFVKYAGIVIMQICTF